MITNAYIIFKDVPQSPDAITHKEFRLQCAWGLILAGAEQVSTSQASQSTKPKSVHLNVKEDTSLPLGRSCNCGHFPIHFEGGKRLGIGFAAGRRGRTQQKTQSFYQRLTGHAPSARNRCVSTMKGIVLPSFISFKWEGGLWCMKRGWGCC